MKELLNKIYYSFYKCEEFFFPYGRKGGYSSVVIIEMLASYQIGIASALSAVTSLLYLTFIRRPFGYYFLIPILTAIIGFCILDYFTKKKVWKEPNEEIIALYKEKGVDVINWFIIGIFVWLLSKLCVFGGIILLIFSLNRITV